MVPSVFPYMIHFFQFWLVMLTSASEPSLAADTSISRRVANSGPVMGLPIGETETYDSQHCQIHMDLSEGCYHISE